MEINNRALMFLTIAILIFCAFIFVQVQKINAQHEIELQLAEEQRLIELNKSLLVAIPVPTATEAPFVLFNPQPIRIDNALRLGEFFNWKTNNASGRSQLNVSITVWDYKTLNEFEYYDYHWGSVFHQLPKSGFMYFLIFVHIEMDDKITGRDVRMYLPQQDNFALQINDMLYYPTIFNYEKNQIKQLENTWDYYHVRSIIPYAYEYVKSVDETTHTNIISMKKKEWLIGGASNSESGYIVFEIPKNYNPRMVKILGSFWSFGDSSWKITE